MRRNPATLLALLMATSALVALPAAADTSPTGPSQTFFFAGGGDGLLLSELAPSSAAATTWVEKGTYSSREGLHLRIPVNNPEAGVPVDESGGADAWIEYTFSAKPVAPTIIYSGYHSGTFRLLLVEGAREVDMMGPCYGYYCSQTPGPDGRYHGDFPGHSGNGTHHTHGDGADPGRPLYTEDFHWLLAYDIPACTSILCLPSTWEYAFEVLVDGTTDVHFQTLPAPPSAEPAEEEAPAANETSETPSNETGNSQGPGEDTESGADNETASEGAGANRPYSYQVKSAQGTSPGAPVMGLLVGLVAMAWARRRNPG